MVIYIRTAHFIDGVTALVYDGVEGRGHILLVVMGGNPHVLVVETCGKGMLGFCDAAVAPIDAQNGHDVVRQLALLLQRIGVVEEAVINGLCGGNLSKQGNQRFPELGKETVQSFYGEALFIFIQQGVIGRQAGVEVTGKLAVEGYDFLQIGGKGFKIIPILGVFPNCLGVVEQDVICHIFLGRNPGNLVVSLPKKLHFTPVYRIQLLEMGLQISQDGFILRIGA